MAWCKCNKYATHTIFSAGGCLQAEISPQINVSYPLVVENFLRGAAGDDMAVTYNVGNIANI